MACARSIRSSPTSGTGARRLLGGMRLGHTSRSRFVGSPMRFKIPDRQPHDGDMDANVAALEVAFGYLRGEVADLKSSVGRLEVETANVRTEVAVIKERLTHVPTKLEMWTGVAVVVFSVGASVGGGLWWLVQAYLGPLLLKAAGG